jgi:hypothetical protein
MSKIISKTIMWLIWLFFALLATLMAHYLTKDISTLNSFSKPFGVYGAGMCVIPVLICGSLRLWLSRIRNPWLALLPFLIGVFFSWQAGLYGVYLLPEFYIVYQVLSVILFAVYLPLFVRLRPAPSNNEPTTASMRETV